jgi:hypothetical protein
MPVLRGRAQRPPPSSLYRCFAFLLLLLGRYYRRSPPQPVVLRLTNRLSMLVWPGCNEAPPQRWIEYRSNKLSPNPDPPPSLPIVTSPYIPVSYSYNGGSLSALTCTQRSRSCSLFFNGSSSLRSSDRLVVAAKSFKVDRRRRRPGPPGMECRS